MDSIEQSNAIGRGVRGDVEKQQQEEARSYDTESESGYLERPYHTEC